MQLDRTEISNAPISGRADLFVRWGWEEHLTGMGEVRLGGVRYPSAVVEGAGHTISIIGELCGHSDLLERVLAVVGGQQSASALNGHFLLIASEQHTGHCQVWTDRFGSVHAYYGCCGNRMALGTSFRRVSEAISAQTRDWIGITGFLGFGFFPDDRTYFDEVRILQPATHYILDENGRLLSAQRYWEWRHDPDWKRSYDDTVSEFGALFEQVMREQLSQGRVALPISGGLDSRCTVAAVGLRDSGTKGLWDSGTLGPRDLSGLNERIWAYSYGYSDDSVETRIARQVAEARDVPFQAFTIKPYLFDRLPEVLAAVEGFQDVTQCRQAAITEELRQHADYVIAAHWGDVWLDAMGVAGEGPRDQGTKGPRDLVEFTLKKMAKRGRAWLLENVCAPQLGKDKPEDVLRQFVAEGLGRLGHIEDPDFRVKAFKTDHWSFRWTLASIRMLQSAAWPRLPFYDTRLADFFCTVPTEYVAGRRLQIDYLKRFAPDLARITWEARDANLFECDRSPLVTLPRRALKKLGRTLTGKQVVQRNWEVQFGGSSGRPSLEHWLCHSGLRLHDFVSPAKTKSLVKQFCDSWPNPELGYAVSMLFTVSACLEQHSAAQ